MENKQSKIENAEKLLKIAKTNRVNPYVDITPFVLDFCVPFVNYDGFFCAKDEVVVYACPANVFKDKEQVVGYRGRSMGSSVRITKGWYMRRGRSGSSAIRAEIRKYYNGDLIVTNKRVVFIGKDESFECSVEKIGAIKLLSKGSFVLQFGRTSKNICVDINITEYAYGLINYVVNAHRDGEDVCQMVEKAYADMTEEQKLLCERVKRETYQLKIPKEKGNQSFLAKIALYLWGLVFIVAILGIIISSAASCSNNNSPSKPILVENFQLSNSYEEEMTLVLNYDSGLFDYGDWDTVLFYVTPSDIKDENLEIINSDDSVLKCSISNTLYDFETNSKKVIVKYEGLKTGKSTFYLKDKNSKAKSCSITITVKENNDNNGDGNQSSSIQTNYPNFKVWLNDTGTKFHFDKNCAGKTSTSSTYAIALSMNKEPCNKCARYLDEEIIYVKDVVLENIVNNLVLSYNENWANQILSEFSNTVDSEIDYLNKIVTVKYQITIPISKTSNFENGLYDDAITEAISNVDSYFENNICDMYDEEVLVGVDVNYIYE